MVAVNGPVLTPADVTVPAALNAAAVTAPVADTDAAETVPAVMSPLTLRPALDSEPDVLKLDVVISASRGQTRRSNNS